MDAARQRDGRDVATGSKEPLGFLLLDFNCAAIQAKTARSRDHSLSFVFLGVSFIMTTFRKRASCVRLRSIIFEQSFGHFAALHSGGALRAVSRGVTGACFARRKAGPAGRADGPLGPSVTRYLSSASMFGKSNQSFSFLSAGLRDGHWVPGNPSRCSFFPQVRHDSLVVNFRSAAAVSTGELGSSGHVDSGISLGRKFD